MDGTPGDTKARKQSVQLRQNGPAIKYFRKLTGYSQDGLAKATGVTQAALSLIENERSCAKAATLVKIAKELRVPYSAITRELEDAA